jgi:trehalose utilization protein
MIKVTVCNECRHEVENDDVKEVYPKTIGGCIVDNLKA